MKTIDPSIESNESKIKNGPSVFRTLLIFLFLVPFNAEILTGSNPIEIFIVNPVVALGGMILYGFQVAILADVAARYRFNYRSIFLLGFVLTIFQEGIGVGTFENTKLIYTTLILKVFDFNISFAPFILAFHSIITVFACIITIRLGWPNRVSKSFLHKKHYFILIFLLLITYSSMNYYNFSMNHLPPVEIWVIQILVMVLLLFVVIHFLKKTAKTIPSLNQDIPVHKYRNQAIWISILSAIVPVVVGSVDTFDYFLHPDKPLPTLTPLGIIAQICAIFILICSLYLAWKFFKRMDADPKLSNEKLYTIIKAFLLFWLIIAFVWRTVISDVFVLFVLPLELYLAKHAIQKKS